jgi:hypothetical protein
MKYMFKTYRKNVAENEINDMCKLGWVVHTAVLNGASLCWEILFERESPSLVAQAKRGRPPKKLEVEPVLLESEE